MHAAQQDVDNWLCGGRQLYELAKQTWQDKSKLERYELVGNYATDLLLLKGLPQAGKLVEIKNLAVYKPQAFTKLGEIGREINQIAGLICAKAPKYLRKSEQLFAVGEAGVAEIRLIEELNMAANLLKHDTHTANAATKISELGKIIDFERNLATLQVEYGSEILHDAKQALNICSNKVLSKSSELIIKEVELACKEIELIYKNGKQELLYELGQGGKISKRSIF